MEDDKYFEEDFASSDTDDTDTADSKSPIFESSPYVLDVHEIIKDENRVPSANQPDAQSAVGQATGQAAKQKMKKIKKKKKKTPSQATVSSESASEISVPTVAAVAEEPAKEEFYDAHGSYHTITQNPVAIPVAPADLVALPAALPAPATAQAPVAAAGLVQARSEHGPDPKLQPGAVPIQGQRTGQQSQGQRGSKTPSTVTKPIDPPE